MVAVGSPLALGGLIMAFAFCVPYMPLAILITWGITSTMYTALDFKYKRRIRIEQSIETGALERPTVFY